MRTGWLKFVFIFLLPMVLWSQNKERNLSSEQWQFKSISSDKYKGYPAKVPGTIHTDLWYNKLIPDPFFGANEKELQWIGQEDWQYQTTFTISKAEAQYEKCTLQFDGLDTYAEVFLNGTKILSADNMFRVWKIEVKNLLKVGANELKISFASAERTAKKQVETLPYTLPGDEKIMVRKAQYHFGWDWGPRFVTAGIYKKAFLQFWNSATITSVKTSQDLTSAEVAKVEFAIELNCTNAANYQLKINDKSEAVSLHKDSNKVVLTYDIKNPKRWWPNGLGEATLYPFVICLVKNNKEIAVKKFNIGLRTIELVQENDAIGKSFYFKVNGQPVFMKGANYIPPDSFLPRVTDAVYQSIVKNAVDAHMNMLRVWGGGVYADDTFYEECDRNGILVWQDFMFACAMYPGDEAFLENVEQEVIDNVTRLQNHPSIALWCGNNESDEGWHNWGWQKQYNYSAADSTKIWNDYQKLFHNLIPQTLYSLLPQKENRYWPSSPSIGWGRKESLLSGDSHYWGVWWGKEPFEMYRKKVGRFMSEYGFQGMPDVKTFLTVASKEDLNIDSEAVKNHQKHPTGYQTINEYMARDYQVPTNFEDYIYVSQLLQAEGMRTAIEAHRQAKPNCMGTLFWQLNDCWPVTSWSSVDYYNRWKALHYQVKRSFEPLLISVFEEEQWYQLYLVNDDLKAYDGELLMEIFDFNGQKLWMGRRTLHVVENASNVYVRMDKKEWEAYALKNTVLKVTFEAGAQKAKTLFYFAKPKELLLTKPNLQVKKIDELTYEITTDVLAKNIMLYAEEAPFFSDNYFDLLPHETVQIKLSKPVKNIEVKSLFDTLP